MTRLSNAMRERSTGWLALLTLIIFLAFTALVLPRQAAQAQQYTAAGSPDASFFYTAADLYTWAEAYGPDGRDAYVRARLTFDVIWPLVYTFFLVTALSWLMPRAFPSHTIWSRANLIPLLAMLFDFLENGAAALVMSRYPQQTPLVASLAGPLTTLKWLFVYASFALLLLALVMAVWRRFQKKKAP